MCLGCKEKVYFAPLYYPDTWVNPDTCQGFFHELLVLIFIIFRYRNSYHPIPRDRGGYDTFEILREDLDAKLKNMLSERVTETDNNATAATKILYSSCMNTSKF